VFDAPELSLDQDNGAGVELTHLLSPLAPNFHRLPELVLFAITAHLDHDQQERGFGRAPAVIGHLDTLLANGAEQDAFVDGGLHTHVLSDQHFR
jgi:hypothetical protein